MKKTYDEHALDDKHWFYVINEGEDESAWENLKGTNFLFITFGSKLLVLTVIKPCGRVKIICILSVGINKLRY